MLLPVRLNLPLAVGSAVNEPEPLMVPLKVAESAFSVRVLLPVVVNLCNVYPVAESVPVRNVPLELAAEPK